MVDNEISQPIDAVILWVDGSDPQHQSKILPYLPTAEKINSKKYKTRYIQVEEIKFTVDSILKFAPFIRNIYIITDNQIPKFLRNNEESNDYKSVSIVDHQIIFKGFQEYLPVFNCRPIETLMHRIPGLAEHFLYFNDDFCLINPTKPGDFFKNGLPVLRGNWSSFEEDIFYKKFKKKKFGHKTAQQNAAKLIGFKKYYRFRHTPHPLRKSTFEDFFKSNPQYIIQNIKYRFRNKDQYTPQGLANHLEIKNQSCELRSDLQLMYFRSYKKHLFWYKFKLDVLDKGKLFLGIQNLERSPQTIQDYILKWLNDRTA